MVDTTATRSSVSSNINDNVTGDITPADVRSCLNDILDDIDTLNGETKSVTVSAKTGTSYTLTNSDSGSVLTFSNASPISITVPSTLPVGFTVTLIQLGAGMVTVDPGAGTTLRSRSNTYSLSGQNAGASLVVYNTSTVNLTGDLL